MLMNFRELLNWLDENMYMDKSDEYYSIVKTLVKEHEKMYIPLKYRDRYEKIGYCSVWNYVGSIEYEFDMYRPIGSGTVYYEVN